jgi:phosphatidylserine/phosphatidylglycerophosphate/cardiolipin synthase-like enzyme
LKYSYLSEQEFTNEFPERFLLLKTEATSLIWNVGFFWDEALFYWEPIYIHSKLRIIDDEYLSVGSVNMNNRGYKYEGEMNLSVWDPDWVKTNRQRIFSQYVGEEYSGYFSDDAQNNFDILQLVAEENQIIAEWWSLYADTISDSTEMYDEWYGYHPSGFIYPLEFSDDYFEVESPDIF